MPKPKRSMKTVRKITASEPRLGGGWPLADDSAAASSGAAVLAWYGFGSWTGGDWRIGRVSFIACPAPTHRHGIDGIALAPRPGIAYRQSPARLHGMP